MERAGWICLSREITEHWIWTDPLRLKWWIDLILMAAPDSSIVMAGGDPVCLGRGELLTSVIGLATRWERHRDTVRGFLQLLEREGMISRRPAGGRRVIVRVTNYDRYQEREPEQGREQGRAQGRVQGPEPVGETPRRDPAPVTSVPVTPAGEEYPPEPAWLEMLAADREAMAGMAGLLGISGTEMAGVLERFEAERRTKGIRHQTLARYREHVLNWARRYLMFSGPENRTPENRTKEPAWLETLTADEEAMSDMAGALGVPRPAVAGILERFEAERLAKGVRHQSLSRYREHAFNWARRWLRESGGVPGRGAPAPPGPQSGSGADAPQSPADGTGHYTTHDTTQHNTNNGIQRQPGGMGPGLRAGSVGRHAVDRRRPVPDDEFNADGFAPYAGGVP